MGVGDEQGSGIENEPGQGVGPLHARDEVDDAQDMLDLAPELGIAAHESGIHAPGSQQHGCGHRRTPVDVAQDFR